MRKDSISDLHSELRKGRLLGRGASDGAHQAADRYKEYPRMPRVQLPEPASTRSLEEAFSLRTSYDQPRAHGGTLSLEKTSALLSGLRERPDGTRPYPSGGALYPVETYLVGSIGEKTPGVYHYHPKHHALEHLWKLPDAFDLPDLFSAHRTASLGWPDAIMLFTALWQRSSAKYGDFAYILSLIEAGHLAQNVLLAAAASDVRARPLESFREDICNDVLHIDGDEEQLVYSIALSL